MKKENLDRHFTDGAPNRLCSICNNRIPKGIKDLGKAVTKYQTSFVFRVCERCLLNIAKRCNKKKVKEWEQTLILKSI